MVKPTHHSKKKSAHPHHNPYLEPAQALAISEYAPRDAGTSWAALDLLGNLIEPLSRNPHAIQDPASTTKLMTFYSVLRRMHEGRLPPHFLSDHKADIIAMLVHSDNQAAVRVAAAADPDGSPWNFSREMTKLARTEGLSQSRFNNPMGYPYPGHYSTAADMARMAYLLKRDFPDHVAWAARQSDGKTAALNTGAQLLAHGVEFGKTGTGDSADGKGFPGYGGKGKFAFSGGVRYGFVAVAAASGEGDVASKRGERNGIVLGLANALFMHIPKPEAVDMQAAIREAASVLRPQTPRFDIQPPLNGSPAPESPHRLTAKNAPSR